MTRQSSSPSSKPASLQVFLARDAKDEDEQLIRDPDRLYSYPLPVSGNCLARLHLLNSEPVPLRWQELFRDQPGRALRELRDALLTVRFDGHVCLVCFGAASLYGKRNALHSDFGTRIILNSILPDSLACAQADWAVDPFRLSTRRVVSPNALELCLNPALDPALLITGRTLPALANILGAFIAGRDAIHLHVPPPMDNLLVLLRLLVSRYQSSDYKPHFPWLDNLRAVTESRQRARLNQALDSALSQPQRCNCWLAEPQIIDRGEIGGYAFSNSPQRHKRMPSISELFSYLESHHTPILVSNILRTELLVLDNKLVVATRWPLRACFYAELHHEKNHHLMMGGRWYKLLAAH